MTNSHSPLNVEVSHNVSSAKLEYKGSTGCGILENISLVPTLFNSIKPQTPRLSHVRALLLASVSGQQDDAEAILKKYPLLALEKLEENDFVIAPTNHQFNLEPYPAALMVGDFRMAQMIKSYLPEAEANRQLNEYKRSEELYDKPIFDQLDRLARTIYCNKDSISISSDFTATVKKNSLVEKELNKFWLLLDATLNEVITIRKKPFIPDQLLLKALQLYEHYYYNWNYLAKKFMWGTVDVDPRAVLFLQKVIGYDGIQHIMPVNHIQAFGDKAYRSTQFVELHTQRQLNFYPLQPRSCPGFNLFFMMGCALDHLKRSHTYAALDALSDFISLKNREMIKLMPEMMLRQKK